MSTVQLFEIGVLRLISLQCRLSRHFFTWIALGNVDLRFSLILASKVNAVEWGTTSAAWLYHQLNQSIHLTDGVTVTSLSGSPNKRQVRPRIVYAKSLSTENYLVSCMPNHVKP